MASTQGWPSLSEISPLLIKLAYLTTFGLALTWLSLFVAFRCYLRKWDRLAAAFAVLSMPLFFFAGCGASVIITLPVFVFFDKPDFVGGGLTSVEWERTM